MRRLSFPAIAAAVAVLAGFTPTTGQLEILVDGHASRVFTSQDLARFPRRAVTVSAHHVTGTYSGVLLADVLKDAGAALGDSLHGSHLSDYVVVEASDKYRVTFGLAELDSATSGRVMILADSVDGHALPGDEGPFRLIVPGDVRPARWAREVVRITVHAAAP